MFRRGHAGPPTALSAYAPVRCINRPWPPASSPAAATGRQVVLKHQALSTRPRPPPCAPSARAGGRAAQTGTRAAAGPTRARRPRPAPRAAPARPSARSPRPLAVSGGFPVFARLHGPGWHLHARVGIVAVPEGQELPKRRRPWRAARRPTPCAARSQAPVLLVCRRAYAARAFRPCTSRCAAPSVFSTGVAYENRIHCAPSPRSTRPAPPPRRAARPGIGPAPRCRPSPWPPATCPR